MPKLKSSLREWPTDFLLTPDLRQYALDRTINPDEEWEDFHDSALANGRQYADWAAAWRRWCRNQQKWKEERGSSRAIGFVPPKLNPATISAIRDNEEIAEELNAMSDEEKRVAKQVAIRKLSEIYRSLK